MKGYCHLHCCSYFSFLSGTLSPENLISLAEKFQMSAIALTDHNGIYGSIIFYKKAKEIGIKPILGAAIEPSIVILAKDFYGYSQLCQLITELHLNPNFSFINSIKKMIAEGLAKDNYIHFIVMTSKPQLAKELSSFFDKDHLYIEVNPSSKNPSTLLHLAESLNLKIVITGKVYFAEEKDYELHRLLRAIDELKTINANHFNFIANKKDYFYSPKEMQRLYSLCPKAIVSTYEIVERCNVDLPIGEFKFPRYPVPKGESSNSFLRKLCFFGALKRYKVNSISKLFQAVVNRLNYELEVIEKLGFSDYFLVVYDVVQEAKRRGIPHIGRGSAANSIVSYVLGITEVDPLQYNLYFERFLNSERKTPPDIDIDFCWKRRDDILNYVYKKYGEDKVAMISTYVCFSGRSSVREVGKALGVSEAELNKFTASLPHFFSGSNIREAIEKIPECRSLPIDEPPFNQILRYAERIDGFPRHLSIHAGGIVISPSTITDYVALEKATKGFVITQYDMFSIEDMGLVKIDLLSQRSLSVWSDTIASIKKYYKEKLPNELEYYFTDRQTKELIKNGETIGCFYIESPAMRGLLKKLKVDNFEMLTAASSVIRPGVAESGMMQQYIRRHHKVESITYLHPKMQEILNETYGVMIYQEDVIRVAHEIIGLSLQEADLLRRAMSGKERSNEKMQELKDNFMKHADANNISSETAQEIWRQISSFAGYAFCKAHSASYAQLSFKVAYLKAHYPAEFMAAVLSNQGGFYHTSVYISEAKRLNLHILLPDINKSDYYYTSEFYNSNFKTSTIRRNNAIRIGFLQIKHLSHKTIETILRERKKRLFKSLPDFIIRTNLPYSEIEILIKIGAMDNLNNLTRPQLLWQLKTVYPLIKKCRADKNSIIRSEDFEKIEIPYLPEYPLSEKVKIEQEYLDIAVSAHPLTLYLNRIKENNFISSDKFKEYIGKKINAIGWLAALKRTLTSKGEYMVFISFEDLCGFYETTLFPRVYSEYGHCLTDRGPYLISGKIQNDFGYLSIICESLAHI